MCKGIKIFHIQFEIVTNLMINVVINNTVSAKQ